MGGYPNWLGCSSSGGMVYPGGMVVSTGLDLKLCPRLTRYFAKAVADPAGTTEVPKWKVALKKQEFVLKLVLLNLKNQILPFVKLQKFVFQQDITFVQ